MIQKNKSQSRVWAAPGASYRSFKGKSDLPLVSILTVCRNAEANIRTCIESVLKQDYPRIEYIVQDGASTDGTLRILAEYGDRIKVESRVDTPNKANYWGLERCTGDIIGMCWTDEELLPGAVSWGVEQLQKRPDAGGIFGDVLATEIDGTVMPHQRSNSISWDIRKYLAWEILPNYCSSYFRRSALEKAGFFDFDVENHCCMYDYYAKVGIQYPIHYIPGFVAKFAMHKNQLSSGSKMLQLLVRLNEASYEALKQRSNTPSWVRELEPRVRAGIRLAMLHSLVLNAEDIETATRFFNEAMQYDPSPEQILKICPTLMQSLLEKEEWGLVATICDEMERRELLSSDMDLSKALVFYKLGRYSDAFACVEKTLKKAPFDPTAQMLFVELQSKRKEENALASLSNEVRAEAMRSSLIR